MVYESLPHNVVTQAQLAHLRAQILSRRNEVGGPCLDHPPIRADTQHGPSIYYQASKSSSENWELGLAAWGPTAEAAAS